MRLAVAAALILVLHPLSGASVQAGVRYRPDGSLLERTTGEGKEQFSYDPDGRLVQVRLTGADGLESITWYSYDLRTGRLALVQEADSVTWFDNREIISFADGNSFEQFEKLGDSYYLRSHIVDGMADRRQGTVTIDEEGNLVHQRQEDDRTITEVYDRKGNLVEETVTQGGIVTQKSERGYDETGLLVSDTISYGDGRKEQMRYEKGILTEQVDLQDGKVVKETRFLPARVETVYSEGLPYARITYKADGRSVGKVEYL